MSESRRERESEQRRRVERDRQREREGRGFVEGGSGVVCGVQMMCEKTMTNSSQMITCKLNIHLI